MNRVNEGTKVASAMSRVWRIRSLGINIKRMMYESVVFPTVLYGAETQGLILCGFACLAVQRSNDIAQWNTAVVKFGTSYQSV